MDNIAHTLSGIVIRDSTQNTLSRNKVFFVVSLFAANAPDIDIALMLGGAETYLKYHRGFTHSIIFIPFFGIIAALLAYFFSKKQLPFLKLWFWFSLMVFVHDTMDWITSYGTQLLWPFSKTPFSANLFPIVDPILIVLMFVVVLVITFKPRTRRRVIIFFLIALSAYSALRIHSKIASKNKVIKSFGQPEQVYSYVNTEKLVFWFNPTLYRVVTVEGDSAKSFAASAFSREIEFQGVYDLLDEGDDFFDDIISFELSRTYVERSRLPVIKRRDDVLLLSDLRYSGNIGQAGGLVLYFPLKEGRISGEPRWF
ncbi:metal-dependent hydrolase [bacterium]|nr:metal-dependent hydrolase [bacterium]